MTRRVLIVLLAGVNLLLLAGLVFTVSWSRPVFAQAPARAGDYLMVAGLTEPDNEVLYLIDSHARKMYAFRTTYPRLVNTPSRFGLMAERDLTADFPEGAMNMRIMNGKDFTIGVLSVTAVVMFVGLLVLTHMPAKQAFAAGQGGMTGDYIVSTAKLDNMTDMLFVTDTVAQEMNMYAFVPARGTLELIQKFDLRAWTR